MRWNLYLVCLSILLFFVVTCGCFENEGYEGEIKTIKPGVLTVGIVNYNVPPFVFEKDGKLTGFDVELITEISRRLGLKPEFKRYDFHLLLPLIKANEIDCAISAISITQKRKQEVSFSRPYFETGEIIVVRSDDNRIKRDADLRGKKVGVIKGTTCEELAISISKSAPLTIVKYRDVDKMLDDLKNGEIDAIIYDEILVDGVIKERPYFKKVGRRLTSEYYGIAVNKNNEALLNAINEALFEMEKDGTYMKLYNKWFGNFTQK
ncbi:ABC transporter substrate-binding protein [Methanotorris igneus]|uniref:ABC-type transporter, periplasmic subunit family 3 n=1 Tax=Methanotorris igneus (strain DSM 5666 / JCM 11834 / Kol 5) TaxID=880724 RepID=F6BCK8_METIK|nr:ABC transporter substrate-binding protein [Methanotorris igneus]AEF96219.1 ABC-type transporter, periplasmic subunit family 3 [Methanotorris igneus Kol 5]